jgi:hypothetical protein
LSSGKRARRRHNAVARAKDHVSVGYVDVRDRFLEAEGSVDSIEWLIQVGRYVQDRWIAEEASREEGEPFDEAAVMHIWDRLTEKQLRDLRADAGTALKRYVAKNASIAFTEWAAKTFKPVEGIVSFFRFFVMETVRGFVGGIGILVLGAVLVWAAPKFVKNARAVADDLLPTETQPPGRLDQAGGLQPSR